MKYFVLALFALAMLSTLHQEAMAESRSLTMARSRPVAPVPAEPRNGFCDNCGNCKCVPRAACESESIVPYQHCSGSYIYVCCNLDLKWRDFANFLRNRN